MRATHLAAACEGERSQTVMAESQPGQSEGEEMASEKWSKIRSCFPMGPSATKQVMPEYNQTPDHAKPSHQVRPSQLSMDRVLSDGVLLTPACHPAGTGGTIGGGTPDCCKGPPTPPWWCDDDDIGGGRWNGGGTPVPRLEMVALVRLSQSCRDRLSCERRSVVEDSLGQKY